MGSYFRISAFYTDHPSPDDDWADQKIHNLCQNCSACLKACPPGAIPEDGFLGRNLPAFMKKK
ncbi:4Fe-4S binding protein [Acidobacteriota bacterium]